MLLTIVVETGFVAATTLRDLAASTMGDLRQQRGSVAQSGDATERDNAAQEKKKTFNLGRCAHSGDNDTVTTTTTTTTATT